VLRRQRVSKKGGKFGAVGSGVEKRSRPTYVKGALGGSYELRKRKGPEEAVTLGEKSITIILTLAGRKQ